jgi:large subunit ribosomal protein L4
MKVLALRSALSTRAAGDHVKIVSEWTWEEPKTRMARGFIQQASLPGKVLVVLTAADRIAAMSFRNLPEARIDDVTQLNTYDVLWADTLLFSSAALATLSGASYEVSDRDFVREDTGDDPAADVTAAEATGSDDEGEEK